MKNLSADVAVLSHYNISMCKLVSHLSEQVNDKGHAVVSSSVCVCVINWVNGVITSSCLTPLHSCYVKVLLTCDCHLLWCLLTGFTGHWALCQHHHWITVDTVMTCVHPVQLAAVCVFVCLSICLGVSVYVSVYLCMCVCVCLVAGDSDSVHHSTYTDSAHSIPANQTYATHSLLPLLCLTLSVIHCSHMFYVHGFDTLVPSTCTGISQGTGHC